MPALLIPFAHIKRWKILLYCEQIQWLLWEGALYKGATYHLDGLLLSDA